MGRYWGRQIVEKIVTKKMDKSKKEEMSIYSKKFFAKKKAASNTPEIKAIAIKQGINKI